METTSFVISKTQPGPQSCQYHFQCSLGRWVVQLAQLQQILGLRLELAHEAPGLHVNKTLYYSKNELIADMCA